MKRLLVVVLVGLFTISVFGINGLAYAQTPRLRDIAGHLFEFEINRLVGLGIVRGFPDGTFRPEAPVTRAEAAVILAGIRKLSPISPAVSPFRDVAPTHWAYGHIVAIRNAGLMRGFPDGSFRPGANILRAELAALLGQAKGLERAAAEITEPRAKANDEAVIPRWAIGWMSIGYFPEHQYLTYRRPRMTAPLASATRGEVAYGAYMVHTPPIRGGTVRVALTGEPDTLCQWFTPSWFRWDINMATHLYATNIDAKTWDRYPEILGIIPTLENGLIKIVGREMEVIYKFRPGLKFSDGTPMTIDDWAYSLMVFMDPRLPVTGRALEESIDFTKGVGAHGIRGFDILDRYSAKVYFRNTDFIASFAHPGGETVLSRRIIEPLFRRVQETGVMDHFTKAHNVARVPVQIGYFRQTEWRPGTRIIHVRNPHSPFGQPNLDSIIFEIIPDTNALLARIIAGGVDAHWGGLSMSHALVLEERIEALKRINQTWHGKIGYAPWFLVEQIWFNHDSPIMADIRIRKAIAHSINRQQIVDTLFEGRQRVVHSYIAPHHWAYSDDIVKYSYDPARARALLEAAGWRIGPGGIRVKDGVRLTLDLRTVAGDRTREMTQSIIKAQLEEVGIEIDTHRNLPSAAFVSRPHLFARAWPHMAMSGLSPGPLWVLESWWSADSIPRAENAWTGSNLTAYTNWEVTKLFKEVRSEMDAVKRKELMAKILRLISEDLPSLPLYLHINPTYSKLELARFYPAVATLARYYGHWWWRKDGKP